MFMPRWPDLYHSPGSLPVTSLRKGPHELQLHIGQGTSLAILDVGIVALYHLKFWEPAATDALCRSFHLTGVDINESTTLACVVAAGDGSSRRACLRRKRRLHCVQKMADSRSTYGQTATALAVIVRGSNTYGCFQLTAAMWGEEMVNADLASPSPHGSDLVGQLSKRRSSR